MEITKEQQEKDLEVRESIKKCAFAIAREVEPLSGLSFLKEDLKDGNITYRFSLTPLKMEG